MTRAASSPAEPVCGFTFDGRRCRKRGAHRCWPRILHVLAFFEECLVHSRGDWAGRPFVPARWQRQEILEPLFGEVQWEPARRRYVRRYRTLYLFVARKNGKSELIAGIMLYLLCAEGEQAAQLYGMARTKGQAGHVYRAAAAMVRRSPVLSERLLVQHSSISIEDRRSDSLFAVLSGESKEALGPDPAGAYIDELLTQPDRDLWDAIRTGMGARAQPLMILATTAESEPEGFAANERKLSLRVRENPEISPRRLVVMHCWPEGADLGDEAAWRAVNPALGDFLDIEVLRAEYQEALENPAALRAFRQYRLNQPINSVGGAIKLDVWDRGGKPFSVQEQLGLPAWGALDLAQTHDLAVLCWAFRHEDRFRALWRCWTPEANLPSLDRRTGGQASVWAEDGWLTVTPGEVIDYRAIKAQIHADATLFQLQENAYDPWGAAQLAQELIDEGIRMVQMRQGWATMSGPTSELLRLIAAGLLEHGGNPVARWCAGNAVTRVDTAGNLKWDKERSADKIDPIVALTMAVARAMVQQKPRRSAYEERGMVTA